MIFQIKILNSRFHTWVLVSALSYPKCSEVRGLCAGLATGSAPAAKGNFLTVSAGGKKNISFLQKNDQNVSEVVPQRVEHGPLYGAPDSPG